MIQRGRHESCVLPLSTLTVSSLLVVLLQQLARQFIYEVPNNAVGETENPAHMWEMLEQQCVLVL